MEQEIKPLKDGEKIVQFKEISDKSQLMALNVAGHPVCTITGYDLKVAFNFTLINSSEDMDDCCNALGQLFRKAMEEQLLSAKG